MTTSTECLYLNSNQCSTAQCTENEKTTTATDQESLNPTYKSAAC